MLWSAVSGAARCPRLVLVALANACGNQRLPQVLQERRDRVGAAAEVKIVRKVKCRVLHSVRHLPVLQQRATVALRVSHSATTYSTARASFTVCSISRDQTLASLFGTAQCTGSGRDASQ